jgi:very-short-patch-repair endonuclease
MQSHIIVAKSGKRVRLSARQWNQNKMGAVASPRKISLKRNPTPAEKYLRQTLKGYDFPHAFQKLVFTPNRYYILDFVVSMKPRAIIELDGSAHDGREEYDAERTKNILN